MRRVAKMNYEVNTDQEMWAATTATTVTSEETHLLTTFPSSPDDAHIRSSPVMDIGTVSRPDSWWEKKGK